MRKVSIYVRVPSPDEDAQPQLSVLRWLARQRRFEIVAEYADVCSGAKARRRQLDALVADAEDGKFSVVLTPSLSCLARDTKHLLRLTEKFSASSIELISVADKLDTTTPSGKQFFTCMAMLRQCEADLVKEHIRLGLRRRRLDGFSLGRTKLQVSCEAVARDRQSMSLTQVAVRHSISRASVVRICRDVEKRQLGDLANFDVHPQQKSTAVCLV
jgi:DNA invertase Pin-like site-specific DNA recombinase